MYLIGITGGLGTGKSTVAALFVKKGAKLIDADAISRDILTKSDKIIKKVAKSFPDAILSTGEIDRAALAGLIFQNPRELKKLTDILYPEILRQIKTQISLYKQSNLVVLDVPLLFEVGWDKLVDTTIVVRCNRQQQFERISKRMGLTKTQALSRIRHQMPLSEKCALADIIIDNRGSIQETRQQVDAIINKLSKRVK